MSHSAEFERYEAVVGLRRHGGRATPIRRMRYCLGCSCGAHLGSALDYIDARRAWQRHTSPEPDGLDSDTVTHG